MRVGTGDRTDWKEAQGTFWDDENVLSLASGYSVTNGHNCSNRWN